MRSWSDSERASACWRRGSPALAAEERILGLVAQNKEIGDELDPVEKTVKNYAWRAWSE
jgi:DNA-binding NarL/FixJ family response regulator